MKIKNIIPILFLFAIIAPTSISGEYEDYYIIKWTSKNCVPCIQWDKIEKKQIEKKVKIVDIDIDKNPELAKLYNIDSIPRFWICRKKDRIVVSKYTGYYKKDILLKAIKDYK